MIMILIMILTLSLILMLICFLFSQAVADWIKHAFISKFNHINANVYDDFARVLRKDILNCHKDKVILDQTYAITKRVGLAQVRDILIYFHYFYGTKAQHFLFLVSIFFITVVLIIFIGSLIYFHFYFHLFSNLFFIFCLDRFHSAVCLSDISY